MDAYEKKILRKLSGVGPDKAFVYQIESADGGIVYIGMTNNMRWRAREHFTQGTAKLGEKIRRISDVMPRKEALQRETDELSAFRGRHGRLPERNRTTDGKYHR